ncbi:histidine phosphotransferase family protein [Hasllibacter halocynthiae]|uniref:histidine phosphotransferase family protein n=1 Tax=Hasllibacter halocynthiae TaxID=595589 RepID=UPI000D061212|nr:histidine phosphotransferase family protein [Hasllibacter halocynthiae]
MARPVPAEGPDLPALVASRICHDLVSPLGAIGNGLELIEMTGAPGKPEMALIGESAADATARIRFFRVAFGAAAPGAAIGAEEVRSALAGRARGSRMALDWGVRDSLTRLEAKAAFLALACLESACAYGGTARAARDGDGRWTLSLGAARLRTEDAFWPVAAGGPAPADLPSSAVQFALLPLAAASLGRVVTIDRGATRIAVRF